MLVADKIADLGEYLNFAFDKMAALWRTVDFGESVHEPVIGCDGKKVLCGKLGFEPDENGDWYACLYDGNKKIMTDVKYWMPLPNIIYHPDCE